MTDDAKRVWALMSKINYCMFVTQAGAGMRGRPMSSVVREDEGTVNFLSDRRAAKDDEILANPGVLLCYSNGASQFVSVAATAAVNDERALLKRLWNPGAKAFWPKGPDDPNIVAIAGKPTRAEFWDGPNAVVSTVKFAVALLTGTTPGLGDHAKVEL